MLKIEDTREGRKKTTTHHAASLHVNEALGGLNGLQQQDSQGGIREHDVNAKNQRAHEPPTKKRARRGRAAPPGRQQHVVVAFLGLHIPPLTCMTPSIQSPLQPLRSVPPNSRRRKMRSMSPARMNSHLLVLEDRFDTHLDTVLLCAGRRGECAAVWWP